MDAERLVKAAAALQGISIAELAVKMGTSQQNLAKRLQVGKFSLEEWQQIATCLDARLDFGFIFSDGQQIKTN